MTNNTLTSEDLKVLQRTFNTVAAFDNEAFTEMAKHWEVVKCKRKQVLTASGDVERYLYLVTDGVQRGYCTYQDKEATMVFFYPNSFAGIADSFLLQRPSNMNFETLTASRLLRISYRNFMDVVEKYLTVEKWLRVLLSHTLAGVLERQKELSVYTATDKLAVLFERSAHIFNLVPHKYLASYIGVDPTTFSKLYSKMNGKK